MGVKWCRCANKISDQCTDDADENADGDEQAKQKYTWEKDKDNDWW